MRSRLATLLLTAPLLPACGRSPAPDVLAAGDVSVLGSSVVESVSEWTYVVEAHSSTGNVLRLLLDTGADGSIVDETRARELALPVRPLKSLHTVSGADGRTRPVRHAVRLDEMRIGSLLVRGMEVLAGDLSAVPLEIDGILGWNVLQRVPTVLDPRTREIHFIGDGVSQDGIVDYLESTGEWPRTWLKMEVLEGRERPFFRWRMGDELSTELLIDTGATLTSFPEHVLEAMGLEPTGTTSSGTATGARELRRYWMEGLRLGEWILDFDVHDCPGEYGMLGLDLLDDFVFLVDGPAKALWLARDADRREGD